MLASRKAATLPLSRWEGQLLGALEISPRFLKTAHTLARMLTRYYIKLQQSQPELPKI
jgi:hypothetical protein